MKLTPLVVIIAVAFNLLPGAASAGMPDLGKMKAKALGKKDGVKTSVGVVKADPLKAKVEADKQAAEAKKTQDALNKAKKGDLGGLQ